VANDPHTISSCTVPPPLAIAVSTAMPLTVKLVPLPMTIGFSSVTLPCQVALKTAFVQSKASASYFASALHGAVASAVDETIVGTGIVGQSCADVHRALM
jgi:hypothetical protein